MAQFSLEDDDYGGLFTTQSDKVLNGDVWINNDGNSEMDTVEGVGDSHRVMKHHAVVANVSVGKLIKLIKAMYLRSLVRSWMPQARKVKQQ